MKPRLFLDMDGVLSDFDAGAERILGVTPYKFEFIWGAKEFWRRLDAVPDFFASLPPMPGAYLLWHTVRHLNPIVLTALPYSNTERVAAQKREWIASNFGRDVQVITCMTKEKPDYCSPGDVLVDDRAVNQAAWQAKGGHYIVHTDVDSTYFHLRAIGML